MCKIIQLILLFCCFSSCKENIQEDKSISNIKLDLSDLNLSGADFTPKVKKDLLAMINLKCDSLETSLKRLGGMSKNQIEFYLDTFKISAISDHKMLYYFNTTSGLNFVLDEQTNKYDSLMNIYYTKLKNRLIQEDKKTLIQAQRAWLDFRDKELELIRMLRYEEYSGGGTMQSNIYMVMRNDLIKRRMIELFIHYEWLVNLETDY